MNMKLEEKVVVITGASSGLGEATARHLASEGAAVALGARRLEKLESIAEAHMRLVPRPLMNVTKWKFRHLLLPTQLTMPFRSRQMWM